MTGKGTDVIEAAALLTALSQSSSSSSSRVPTNSKQQQQPRSDTHLLLEKLHSLSAQLALASPASSSSTPSSSSSSSSSSSTTAASSSSSSSPPSNAPFVLPEERIRRFQTDALRQDTFRALDLKPPKRDPRIDIDGDKVFALPDLPFSVPKNLDTSTSNIVDALCYEYRLKITDLSHTFSNCLRERKKLVLQQHKVLPINKPTLTAAMRSLTQHFQQRYDVHVRDLHHQAQSRIERVVSDTKGTSTALTRTDRAPSASKLTTASDISSGSKKDSKNNKKKKKKKKKCSNPAKLSKAEGDKYLVNYYNQDHHPDVDSKLALAYKTGRTYDQINTWFANRRTRHGHTVRRDHEQALKTPPTADEIRGGQLQARQAAQLAASLIPSEAVSMATMMIKGSGESNQVIVHKARATDGNHPSSPSSTDSPRSGCARANNYRRKTRSEKIDRTCGDHSDVDLNICDDDDEGDGVKSSSATISATPSKSSSRASSIPPPPRVNLQSIASPSPRHQAHKEEEQREAMKATPQNQYPYQQINYQYPYPSTYHPYINHIHNGSSYPVYPYPYHPQPILPSPLPSTTRTNYGQYNHHPTLAPKTSVLPINASSSSSSVAVLAAIASTAAANAATAALAPADCRMGARRPFTPYYGHRHILPHQTQHHQLHQRPADERRFGDHMKHDAQGINAQYASPGLPEIPTHPILVQQFDFHSSTDIQSSEGLTRKGGDHDEIPEMMEFCGVSDNDLVLPVSVLDMATLSRVHPSSLPNDFNSTVRRKVTRKASEMDVEGGGEDMGSTDDDAEVKRRKLDDKENATQRRSVVTTTGEKELSSLGDILKETEEDRCVKELDVLPARTKVMMLPSSDPFSDELFPEVDLVTDAVGSEGMDERGISNNVQSKTECWTPIVPVAVMSSVEQKKW